MKCFVQVLRLISAFVFSMSVSAQEKTPVFIADLAFVPGGQEIVFSQVISNRSVIVKTDLDGNQNVLVNWEPLTDVFRPGVLSMMDNTLDGSLVFLGHKKGVSNDFHLYLGSISVVPGVVDDYVIARSSVYYTSECDLWKVQFTGISVVNQRLTSTSECERNLAFSESRQEIAYALGDGSATVICIGADNDLQNHCVPIGQFLLTLPERLTFSQNGKFLAFLVINGIQSDVYVTFVDNADFLTVKASVDNVNVFVGDIAWINGKLLFAEKEEGRWLFRYFNPDTISWSEREPILVGEDLEDIDSLIVSGNTVAFIATITINGLPSDKICLAKISDLQKQRCL